MQARQGSVDGLRGLDLAPLYRECLLDSRERRETYDVIASELCDYGLTWRGAAVEARAYRCRTDRLAVYSLSYGDEVSIKPDLYPDFLLVHVCLRNGIEVESDGETTHVPEGGVFFSAPQRRIGLRWQEGCEQLIVRVPHALAGLDGAPLLRSGAFLPPELSSVFVAQLNMLMALARQPVRLPGLAEWTAEIEQAFARFAALQLFDVGETPARPRGEPLPHADRRDRLMAYLESRLSKPVRLDDLAAAVGLGRSQLNALTQDAFGCAPMALLRRLRLEAARRDLAADPHQDLTQLSLRYGFEHQGRFSQYYRARFGEAPRETRGRLAGKAPAAGRFG